MPLGAARISFLAKTQVTAVAEVIRKKVGVSAVGDAYVDNTQSKFGQASLKLDGTGDYLLVPSSQGLVLDGDFTIEMWINASTRASSGTATRLARFDGDGAATATGLEFIFYNGSAYTDNLCVSFGSPRTYIVGTVDAVTSSWVHVALSRSGTDMKLFINGTQSGSTATTSANFNSSDTYAFNLGRHNTLGGFFNGHVDEFRISDTARYTTSFTPSTTPFVNDDNTLLLLHMNLGNRVDTNNYFEDDNGVRTQKSAIGYYASADITTTLAKFGGGSYSSGISSSDRGSGKRLTTDVYLGSGDFTVECWFMPKEDFGTTTTHLWATRTSSSGIGVNVLIGSTTNNFRVYEYIGGSLGSNYVDSSNWTIDTWHHIAVCRDGNTVELFLDGVSQGSYTNASTADMSSLPLAIGNLPYASVLGAPGAIDEFRVSDNVRYTTDFTPQTAPFVNDANTVMLLHMDGTEGSSVFKDDNGYHTSGRTALYVFPVNDAQVDTAQSQFGGASALFDGTGDYLVISGNNDDIDFSGDFTIECWFRSSDVTSNAKIFDGRGISSGQVGGGDGTFADSQSTILIDHNLSNFRVFLDGANRASGSTSVSNNTWYHCAVSRTSGTVNAWLNGTRVVDYSCSDDFTNVFNKNQPIGMGASLGLNQPWDGHIDEFRISTVARYTNGASITVPTSPFQNDADTYLLLHMDGADGSTTFQDDVGGRARVGVSAIGNAQIDIAQSKFGGASAYFDGTGDYIFADINYSFGSSQDFTWECWFRQDTNTNTFPLIFGNYTSYGSNDWGLFVDRNNDNTIRLFVNNLGGELLTSTTTIADDTWYHVAVTRSGSSWNLWVDGTSEDTATNSGSIDTANRDCYIGADPNTSTTFFHGWVDELRWSDTARYTTSFTPSTTPFQNDDNTLLLLHMDGTDGSTVFIDDNGTY